MYIPLLTGGQPGDNDHPVVVGGPPALKVQGVKATRFISASGSASFGLRQLAGGDIVALLPTRAQWN